MMSEMEQHYYYDTKFGNQLIELALDRA